MSTLGDGTGADIVQSVPHSAAARAGIGACDTIRSMGGRRVSTNTDLVELLAAHREGDDLDVAWVTPRGSARFARVRLTGGPPA